MTTSAQVSTTETSMRWVRRASTLLLLALGWIFILAQNSFHVTPSSVFIGLGYTAAVAAVYTLFRTGALAMTPNAEDAGEMDWGTPIGPRGELEREKRTLLKAIKEAEFDHQMGKLSKADADAMIAQYRARAIIIIKQLDTASATEATKREAIEREVRARLAVAPAGKTLAAKKVPKKGAPTKGDAKAPAKAVPAVDAAEARAGADDRDSTDEPAEMPAVRDDVVEHQDSTAATEEATAR